MNPKQLAAAHAVSYIQDGMTVGLGTGRTAAFAIEALGARLQSERLSVRCLATSRASHDLAQRHKIPLADWDSVRRFDISIDGADEVDGNLRLIKGGGGALVREKIVAAATAREIIVVDDGKVKAWLGAHPLPVAVLPFGWQKTRTNLETRFGCPATLRTAENGAAFVSDDGLYIVDMAFGGRLPNVETLEAELKAVVGVVEVGLFVGLCQHLIIGYDDGRLEEKVQKQEKTAPA